MSDYFIVIPAQVRTDKNLLPLDKLIYGEVAALASKNGTCWAQNSYFANIYNVRSETVSRSLKKLEHYGYITLDFEGRGNSGRKIIPLALEIKTLDVEVKGLDAEVKPPLTCKSKTLDLQVKQNKLKNITSLIFTDTQPAAAPKKKVFKPPTLSEVQEYCTERDNGIDPQTFLDFYEARGWMCGRSKMKDWRASVRLWERRSQDEVKKPEYHFVE